MTSRLTKTINLGFIVLGAGILIGLLIKLDIKEVGQRMIQVGWYFPFVLLAYTASNLLTTLAWMQIVDPASTTARYRDFLAAFWAGHAINALTPTATMGEVLRGTIMKNKVDGEEIVASLVVLHFLNTLSVNIFTLLAPIACLIFIDLPTHVVAFLFGVALAFFIPLALLYALIRVGAAHKAIWLVSKLPMVRLKNPDVLLAKAGSIDCRIRAFRSRRPAAFSRTMVCLALVRLLQAVEVWIILMALLPKQGPLWLLLLAFLTQTATQLIAWGLTFIPGQVGVAEGGAAMLYKFMGMDPLTGFSMELVRRVRKLIGIAIGLIVGFWINVNSGNKQPPTN